MHRKVHIDIDFGQFINFNYKQETSCINDLKKDQTIYEKFGGLPESYVYQNTILYQKFWNKNECNYKQFEDQLDMDVVTVSSIMQPPGCVIPIHQDAFFQTRKKFPNTNKEIVRANIYLEDWKQGHFLQVNNVVDFDWKQGDGHMWNSDVLHIGANNGMQNKYTLQVTGFYMGR